MLTPLERKQKKKKLFRWIKVLLLLYAVIGIALYYLQDYMLFHPLTIEKNKKYDFNYPHKEINIPYNAETNFNIIQFSAKDSTPKGVVLYFHGNRKNISWYAKYAPNFTGKNYEVWMIDYPGFGKSTGKFSEQRLYDCALQLYKLARTKYDPANIIIYGKSMGTGIAAQLASIRDSKYLILETPYYSMTSLISHYLPIYPIKRIVHYRLPTYEFLEKVTAPVIIFHGTDDGIVPLSNAEQLKSVLKKNDEFVIMKNGSHNNLNDFPLFHQKLDSLLER
ncbi:MAG: alpha/beta fold hydrolase [Bacteroidetes bacterium]|nr:alpha/beta fold hydrolase [Bacteroidota bacterium]